MFISANDTLAPEFALVESKKRSIFTKIHFDIIDLTDKKTGFKPIRKIHHKICITVSLIRMDLQ